MKKPAALNIKTNIFSYVLHMGLPLPPVKSYQIMTFWPVMRDFEFVVCPDELGWVHASFSVSMFQPCHENFLLPCSTVHLRPMAECATSSSSSISSDEDVDSSQTLVLGQQ